MANRIEVTKKVNRKTTFLNKCEVSNISKKCPTCGGKWEGWVCGEKAVARINTIKPQPFDKRPFWVCAEHKKSFLKCNKGEEPYYREVKPRKKRSEIMKIICCCLFPIAYLEYLI